jgi:hypothetical protein
MPDMSYNTDQLREGGRTSRLAGDRAEAAASTVSGAPVAAGPFGNVSPAGPLASVLSQAQQHHTQGAHTAAANRNAAGQRADITAEAGDDLVLVTTAAARNVANGMA